MEKSKKISGFELPFVLVFKQRKSVCIGLLIATTRLIANVQKRCH